MDVFGTEYVSSTYDYVRRVWRQRASESDRTMGRKAGRTENGVWSIWARKAGKSTASVVDIDLSEV